MPQSDISSWMQFAIQQMVAESYLDGFAFSNTNEIIRRLEFGNNNASVLGLSNPNDSPNLSGKTRFVNLSGVSNATQITGSAQAFVDRYQIVDHHANDATGFSATLMQERGTNNFTLSFRGTEYPNQSQGGDWERDGLPGADGEIFFKGFAFGQLVSMEKYYQQLKADGWLPQGAMLNVTGYSLGGHLATVFTELHAAEIQRTYTFNGAGHGEIAGGAPGLPAGARIAEMLEYFSDQLVSQGLGDQPFASGATGNLYTDSRYQTALQAVFSQYQPASQALSDIPRSDGAFAKITQIVGHATQGDTDYVANSGNHAAETSVYIEDQPDFDGFGGFFGANGAYGTTHSITLIVDSLALQELFQTLSPILQPTQIEAIFTASSNDMATGTTVGLSGSAEAKPLENALDALRRLFLTGSITETPSDPATGGFGNLANRNTFYEGIATVKTALAGGTVTIEPFVELNAQGTAVVRLAPSEVNATALENTDRGLAFRYALKNLNPFAVIGADYQALGHASNGVLTLFDPNTGFGEMTEQYLTDRAAFLLAKLDLTLNNQKYPSDLLAVSHYQDIASGFDVPAALLTIQREYLFGGANTDTLSGHELTNDHLYGSGGNDTLRGFGGDDYLQGDSGDDWLDAAGGSDRLNGGLGFDTYVLNADGIDTITDGDDRGRLLVNGQLMVGGIRRAGEAAHTFHSMDNLFTFMQSGSTLTINGHVSIQDWQSGDLGIMLRDLSSLSDGTTPVIDYTNGLPTHFTDASTATVSFDIGPIGGVGLAFNEIVFTGSGSDGILAHPLSLGNHQFHGGAGNDALEGALGHDRLYGEAGLDWLRGSTGNDVLDGGNDQDILLGEAGQDVLTGGTGDDFLQGGLGRDMLFGGDGDDTLLASATDVFENEADYLDGGAGDDFLWGGQGDDVLLGGSDNDTLRGDNLHGDYTNLTWLAGVNPVGLFTVLPPEMQFRPEGGTDYLDGGAGEDVLYGEGGDDVLLGGTENDMLYGDDQTLDEAQAGKDFLDGGAGDDQLFGGGGADRLIGGADNDTLIGDFLNDPIGANDWLDGGAGNDTLAGGRGDDVLFGGNDQDFLLGNEGQDVLDGGSGLDQLYGGSDDDVLWGGTEDDQLFGEDGTDTLFGGDGFDTLVGGDGNDVLVGGAGVDVLAGGAGADTYIFNLGDGIDTIQETAGEGNRLVFGAGISANDIRVGIGSLVVRVGLTGDAVHIQGFDPANPSIPSGIEQFEFADGTTLTHTDLIARGFDLVGTAENDLLNGGELYRGIYGLDGNDFLTGGEIDNVLDGGGGNDVILGNGGVDQLSGGADDDVLRGGTGNDGLTGGSGNDSLEGEAGDDVLVGGAGDDQLLGGAGADTYQFHLGDGIDSISDSMDVAEPNRVVFGSGITSASLTLTTDVGEILVRPSAAFEGVKVGADGSDALGFHAVDLFQFEDGTSLTYADLVARGFDLNGTEFDDWLFGTNVIDRFRGGLGNDRLEGGEENDTYFFNLGDGVDTIVDATAVGAGNEVIFGAGIASADLRLDLAPDQSHSNLSDLLIRVGTGGDAIQLDTFDRTDVVGLRTVESFRFADGSLLTYDQLLAQGFDLTGTDGDDQMSGTNVADRIVAGDGADVLQSGLGDDSLDGGAGNDRLIGGEGNDTYVFGPSSGHDTILEFQGSQDTIRMAPGVAPSDVVVTRQNRDLVLSLNGGAAQLRVLLYFAAPALQVERVTFADGTVWDRTVIETLAQPTMTGTAGSDSLLGTSGDDRLAGLAGDDQLTGLAGQDLLDGGAGSDTLSGGVGDDRLDGGPGADTLIGGVGDDTYVVEDAGDVVTELAGEGIDTVQSSLTYTLGANVEHLTLTGSTAINGTGNVLNNVLTGNRAVNILTGGLGDDTYVIGSDDTVVEQVGEGTDTIATDQSYALGADLENLTLIGNQSVNGSGNALDNVLTGNAAANILTGGIGNDTYVVGANDIVVESAGEGTDTIQTAQDYRLEANVENLILLDTKPTLNVGLTSGTGQLVPVGPAESFSGTGNALDNVLVGNRADNALEGLSGNDRLDGRGGNDTLMGGAGADTYLFGLGHGQDRIDDQSLGCEIDTIQFAAGLLPYQIGVVQSGSDLVLRLPGSQDSLTLGNFFGPLAYAKKAVQFEDGTLWDETMLRSLGASQGPGVFFTDPGTSPIDNVFSGTTGDDEIRGTIGNDTIFGGAGNDILRDNQGNNILDGGSGDDSLFGGGGNDTFVFGRGYSHDTVFVDHLLRGSLGLTWSDVSTTDTDTIQLVGLQASDVAIHMQASDAGQASFTITVLDTADQLTVRFRNGIYGFAPAPVILTFSDGTSQAVGPFTAFPAAPSPTVHSLVDYVLGEDEAHLVLLDLQSEVAATARTGIGNSLDNVMLGNTADNILDGGAGNDVLSGGFARSVENFTFIDTGSDILLGGEGDDVLMPFGEWAFAFDFGAGTDPNPFNTPDDLLIGGPGNDTYYIQHAGQTLVELPNEGVDTVRSTVTYTLPDNVENLVLIPTAIDEDRGIPALIGTGNTLDNVLIGGGGEDLLIGGAGHDTLYGGSALSGGDIDDDGIPDAVPVNDTLVGGAGHDTYLFNVGDGLDTIDDTVTVGEGNRIQFGLDIGQSDLTFVHDEAARTLMIQVGSRGTDQLRLTNFDPTGANGSLVVATLAFADGSTAQLADLLGGLVNHAPTVATPLADQTVAEGAPFSLTVPANTFADEDAGDLLTLSASLADGTALPAWLTFDAATRIFSGMPDDAQVGSLDLRVEATDHENLNVSDVFRLTVTNVNEVPTVVSPLADQQATEDVPFSFVVPTGTFADVDLGDTLTYSAALAGGAVLPTWLSFNATTRVLSGTPLNNDVGTLNIAVKASDLGSLSATDTFALAIQNVNDAPTVENPLVDQTVLEDAPFSIQVPANAFVDEDAGDVLSYSATLANGSALPTWLSFNATTRTFTGTPDDAQVGTLDLRVTATDSGNLSVSDVLTLTVANVNEAPTVVAPLADQQATQGAVFSLVVPTTTFTDVDPGDVLIYSATLANGASLPSWLSFNSVTRTFNGTPQASDVGMIDVRVTVTDQGDLNTADVFALTIAPSGGTAGNDTLIGTSGNDVLDGLAGDDVLRGLAGNDTLLGGGGNDLLDGGLGTDSMTGGTGSDTYVVSTGDTVVEAANAGTDTVLSNVSHTLAANVELLVLTGTNTINGTGNSLANGITGNAASNVLDGGAGADVLAGLDGQDTYLVDNTGDLVIELANNGVDTVQSSVTFTLGANVENLTLIGIAAINGTGNGSANVMIGNNGANVFSGAGGADTLRGGLGNDTLNGGGGNDTFLFGRGDGQDLVQDNSGMADKLLYDAGINPLDLVISRQANNLRLSIHGSTDHVMIQNWYASSANRTETIQAGNGQALLSTQVDQLIQAMAGFTTQTGLTWDQAIDQRPQDVQTVLAASWQ